MSYYRRLQTQVKRHGREATVLAHSKGTEDAFGNPDDSYTEERRVHALRTYPGRNEEMKGPSGDLHQDDPVFIIPRPNPNDPSDDTPEPPDDEDHLVYDDVRYALQAPTYYDTHVEFGAERVVN